MNYESIIARYLRARHGKSAARSNHMLTNADRTVLADEHGPGMAACIRRVANDPTWEWTAK